MAPYSTLSIEFNDLGTAVITFHRADDTINRIDPIFVSDFTNAIAELSKTKPKGIILRAKQGVFLAGADLNLFLTTNANMQPKLNHLIDSFKRTLRLLETLGCPAVACLSGAALGGGWEMALACHHRIAISPHTQVGLPEVTLGLLPGAGGITRTIRLFGLEDSIPMLCLGTVIDAHQALEKNWLQAIVDTPEQAIEHAQQWIEQNPTAQQPWSMKCASPKPSMDKTFIEQWRKKLNRQEGGRDPAPVRILEIALKSVELSFTESERLEAEALADLAHGPVSQHKIMLWRQQQQLIKGEQRPEAPRSAPVNTLGVIGAGMMGRGICETAAIHNINVKLMDKDETTAAKAKTAIGQGIQRNCSTLSPDKQALIMGRIKPSNHLDDCQLIIEAVYEDEALKSQVIQSIPNPTHPCYIASNTSTLPISKLSQSCYDPSQFLGLHFFSPVSKMPLVEIICGQHTSNETLAYGWDFVRQLQKVPMVVKDGCGFFTTRLFASYTAEGLAMIEQGYSAHDIERAAFQQGFPMGHWLLLTKSQSL